MRVQNVMGRFLTHPNDFQNNARLLQLESLITETVDFEAR